MADLPSITANGLTPSGPPAKRRNGKRPFVILITLVVLLLLIFGVYAFLTRNQVSTDDAQVEADVTMPSMRVAGVVVAIPVHDNQHVKAGDVLIEIDPADYRVRVEQAEAQVEAAEAQERIAEASSRGGFNAARASLSGSTVSVANAAAQVAAARAALQRAQAEETRSADDFRRYGNLLASGSISQSDYDHIKTAYESASATLDQARAQLTAAEEQKRTAESRVTEARGHVEQSAPVDATIAAAALENARLQLSYTKLTAPFDGALSRLAVRVGQAVQPMQAVAELVPLSTYVVANFKETQIGRMKPGQRVAISIDTLPGRHFEGEVQSLSPGTGARFSLFPPDNASGNFVKVVQRIPVKIIWRNLPAGLMPQAGLSANVTVYFR
jgi:membrane fusion protein (multidrug efflux system)